MEQRNMVLAIALSMAILFGFEYFRGLLFPEPPAPVGSEQPITAESAPGTDNVATPTIPGEVAVGQEVATGAPKAPVLTRLEAIANTPRVRIESPRISGSITLRGGRIDDITLTDYRQELQADSLAIELFSPATGSHPYYAQFGWIGSGTALPDQDTLWQADNGVLKAGGQVTLSWNNGQGLVFKRTYALDQHYMFTVTQTVENTAGQAPLTLYPYGLISRTGTPDILGFYILHEGPLGVFDGTLKEIDYEDLVDADKVSENAQNGWAGITDKYWLAALVPNNGDAATASFAHYQNNNQDKYQVDLVGAGQDLGDGGQISHTVRLFAGAKEVKLLDRYAEELGIARFDLAIDFGWFYFLTKPIFLMLLFFHDLVGNLGVAILLLTVLVKLALFPLANKSYVSMSKMKKLQPKMKQLQERYSDDKARLNQEMMALYKTNKVNPASGCLPIFLQIPVFFALYKVLFVTIEMRHAPFFGWIQDLSAPDPLWLFNLFGAISWTPPDFLQIGIWPIIMGLTMWGQQKLNPQPTDPTQAKIMAFLPLLFTFLLGRFPAGLVIYWAWNNLLSIAQQWVIMRRMGAA